MKKIKLNQLARLSVNDGEEGFDQGYFEHIDQIAETCIECWINDPFIASEPELEPEIQRNIDELFEAKSNILELEKELAIQKARLAAAERALRAGRVKEEPIKRGRGRPKIDVDDMARAKRFVQQWVKSVRSKLGARSCAELENFIPGTNQRNWTRWQNQAALPTARGFIDVIWSTIKKGEYKEKCLVDVQTRPKARDLLTLLFKM